VTGQNDNGTVTQPPTDDELSDIWHGAVDDSTAHLTVAYAEARRALYEAGRDSKREATRTAFYLGRKAGLKMLRDHEVARVIADRTGAAMSDVEDALAYAHDRITGGEQ
jgi:hypothetical protein